LKRALIIAVLLAIPARRVPCCDLCAVYNASAARGESGAGFHAALAEQFTHSGTLQHNGDEISDPSDQFRDSSITSLIFGYNFNPRFGLSVNIPYIHRSFRRAEGFEIETGTESGLGDMSLLGRFVAYSKPEHDYSIFVSLLAGVEFPTGDSDRLQEEVEEEEVPGAPPSGVHGNDLALGSGSFDPIVGLSSNARWKRFSFALDLQYFIRTRGDFGYRFGSELSVSGGPGFYLLFEEDKTLALLANINYETKAHDRVAGEKRDDGILAAWYAGPGLIFTFGENLSLTANVDLPLRIANRSFQTVPDYRVRGGVTWNF
jgi:outer membrane putative beta-barrel porin/alpha-amylase